MAHKRNVDGLRTHARRRHRVAVERTEEAINFLIKNNRPVNFRTVAEAACVSTAWLYQQPSVRERIQRLRERRTATSGPPIAVRMMDASKDGIIAVLRERLKKIEKENRELRRQLEVAYGQICCRHEMAGNMTQARSTGDDEPTMC